MGLHDARMCFGQNLFSTLYKFSAERCHVDDSGVAEQEMDGATRVKFYIVTCGASHTASSF